MPAAKERACVDGAPGKGPGGGVVGVEAVFEEDGVCLVEGRTCQNQWPASS